MTLAMKYNLVTAGAFLLIGSALAVGIATQDDSRLATGLRVGEVPIGDLTATEALKAVQEHYGKVPQLTINAGERTWKLNAEKLGWKLDAESAIAAASEYTNGRNVLERLEASLNKLTGNVPQRVFRPRFQVDETKTRDVLKNLAKRVNRQPTSATVGFDRKTKRYAVLSKDLDGQKADVENAVKSYLEDPTATVLNMPVRSWEAKYTSEKAQEVVDKGNAMMRPFTVVLGGSEQKTMLSPLQMANLYWVKREGIVMDDKALKKTFKRAVDRIDKPARSARYAWRKGAFVVVPERTGYVTDREPAYEVFYKSISDIESDEVSLPAKTSQPQVTAASLPDPKNLQLIARGTSNYYGSTRARRVNIANAARKIDGTVVGRGENFSFLQALGGITVQNGFVSGLVISGGRTIEGLGGGVCQVSTTAFRALYNAGFPVVERNQHSYRVKYYEPAVGFEAAVYDPGVDLRMKNDTSAPILVRAFNNNAKSYLEVQIWGIKPKRTVRVSRARITSSTPHPPARTIVNPRLRRGVVRQVDWAQNGYTMYITRTIKDASGARYDRVDTNYRPWRAVFERGPS